MPGQIPPGAIKVGVEADGSPLFAARNFHEVSTSTFRSGLSLTIGVVGRLASVTLRVILSLRTNCASPQILDGQTIKEQL
jgi:hypothetical protein